MELAGSFATIVRKGDARAGAVLVKILDRRSGAARLYAQATVADGQSIWMQPAGAEDETAIDVYITRAGRIDPDIWVVEIEDSDGGRFLTEQVEGR